MPRDLKVFREMFVETRKSKLVCFALMSIVWLVLVSQQEGNSRVIALIRHIHLPPDFERGDASGQSVRLAFSRRRNCIRSPRGSDFRVPINLDCLQAGED